MARVRVSVRTLTLILILTLTLTLTREDDEWLPAYARVAKYLEITRRAEVLNKRLDINKELFDMLASEYHNSHASMLEWIIIILIVIEVFFQVVSLCLDGTTGL